ncbi:MAG: serine/threonine-protein phosphatase [Burkholderiaceae bacterium]|nr:serine/threonine-protein phosphatase [Burkholderiaceae bacterium]
MSPTPDPAGPVSVPAIDPAQAQHQGRRESQQDAFGFSNLADADFAAHAGYLAVLADGMGGMRNGLWSASHAVQAFIEAYHAKTADETIPAALQRSLVAANAVVHEEAERLNSVDRMGTTLAVAVVRGLELHWLNVGDSRVYLAEDGHLMCLSTDHSFAEILRLRVHRGELSAGEALGHPLRHALTSYLGRPEPVQHAASRAAVQLRPGAWVLLCSDGLTQALDDEQIAAQLNGGAQQACDRLLDMALARKLPDQDNTTAVVLHVPRPGQVPEAGSVSRAVYGVAPILQRAAPDGAVPPAAARPPLRRPRWREPLWWAGAAAALCAVGLFWLSRPPTAPQPAAAVGRSGPAVDLLAPAASSRGTP